MLRQGLYQLTPGLNNFTVRAWYFKILNKLWICFFNTSLTALNKHDIPKP